MVSPTLLCWRYHILRPRQWNVPFYVNVTCIMPWLGRIGNDFQLRNLYGGLTSWAFPMKLHSGESHTIPLKKSQHWLKAWLVGQQAITSFNVDPYLCCLMVLLSQIKTIISLHCLQTKQAIKPNQFNLFSLLPRQYIYTYTYSNIHCHNVIPV